jgi:hypothetical protein
MQQTTTDSNPLNQNNIVELNPQMLKKVCPACGTIFYIDLTQKRRGRQKKFCRYRCGTDFHCRNVRTKDGERDRMKDYFRDFPEKRFLASTKSLAKERKMVFDLDEAWFKERLDRGICEVTGLPIKVKQYVQGARGDRGFFSPSIDRIDNAVGYIPSNCRIVCWCYNLCKNQFTDREVNALALGILIQSIPRALKTQFVDSLPNLLASSLPSGHTLF